MPGKSIKKQSEEVGQQFTSGLYMVG